MQDLKIVAHHTLQDILKIIMSDLATQVISQGSRWKQNGYCI